MNKSGVSRSGPEWAGVGRSGSGTGPNGSEWARVGAAPSRWTQGSVFQDRLRHLPYPVVEQRERCYNLTDRRRIVQINHRVQREFFRSDTLLARAKR